MIKNTGKGLTDIKADLSLEGVNRKIYDISKWINDCPFAWGNDNPENLVYGNLGDLYVDKKTGSVYKKKYNSGENNGWVEIKPEDIGTIKMWGSNTLPENYLNCDGSAISRINYSLLFKLIGTTFGSGDNVSTFNLPDLRSATARGVGSSTKYTYNSSVTLGQYINDQLQHTDHCHLEYTDNSAGAKIPLVSDGETVGGSTTGKYGAPGGPVGSRWLTTDWISYWRNNYGSPRVGYETTCKAVGLYYIIKVL